MVYVNRMAINVVRIIFQFKFFYFSFSTVWVLDVILHYAIGMGSDNFSLFSVNIYNYFPLRGRVGRKDGGYCGLNPCD